MDAHHLQRLDESSWCVRKSGKMRVPAVLFADEQLIADMDDKVVVQLTNVATLPGIVEAAYAMPDAHWGYGFPIGGVAAFDPDAGGVISAGGVQFDISCGVRTMLTGLPPADVRAVQSRLADALFARVPAGVGSRGRVHLDADGLDRMLRGGARWAIERGYGTPADLDRIEERGCMSGAEPEHVSERARDRQRDEMGTLGSGNHYLEVQRVARVLAPEPAAALGLREDEVVVSIHCGSRGLGHQIGTDYLREMTLVAAKYGLDLPDRELACAPVRSPIGEAYLGAMRAATNCALANRQIITHLTREVFAAFFAGAELPLLYDVSHNTCKVEEHVVRGAPTRLFVHRKGATRAFGPGHPELPLSLRDVGQPVLIGGSMGTASYVLVGTEASMRTAFGSACHGAGRKMSRHAALGLWRGRQVVDELGARGITIRSPSYRGVAEEAPLAYKDVRAVVEAADKAGLARIVARLEPMLCVKG